MMISDYLSAAFVIHTQGETYSTDVNSFLGTKSSLTTDTLLSLSDKGCSPFSCKHYDEGMIWHTFNQEWRTRIHNPDNLVWSMINLRCDWKLDEKKNIQYI